MYTNPRIPDSVVSNEDYAKRAAELGHGIISTAEHGWQGRYIEGHELAQKYGLKFVFGTEAYWVKDRLENDRNNCHIYLGARNENGRQAINDILSEANITGYYYQPRIDIPLLLSLPKDDVIVTSACVAFWKYDDVDEIAVSLAEHFGKNFFLEVQYHNTAKQRELNKHILKLSAAHNIPIIMGCDSHYIVSDGGQDRADYIYSKGIEYPDEEGWFLDYPDGDEAYSRFAKQCVLSHEEIEQAITNTNTFLDVTAYDNPCFTKDIKMPVLYPDLTQEQKNEVYHDLVWEKWEEEKQNIPPEEHSKYEEEIRKEIEIVDVTNHAEYFLLDYKIVERGLEKGGIITPTGRGSGVSFITNKLLGFTEVDRVSSKVHMYPERFMSATRILETKSLADLDLNLGTPDVFAEAQEEIMGVGHSAPMIAYGTLKPPAAWKMYAKSQNVEFELANEISQQIKKWQKAVAHAPDDERDDIDVLEYIDTQYHEIYLKSVEYQGIIADFKPHPCSYLLYDGDIRREVGMIFIKPKTGEGRLCCVMDGKWAEDYKFLKNDLLKVSVAEMISKVYKRIGIKQHKVSELLEICTPDNKAWDVYARGCTMGVNQVEQRGTSQRVMKYKPTNITELCAFIAAIRPGFKSMYKIFESKKPFDYGIKSFDDLIQTPEMPNTFVLYQEMSMATLNYAGIPMSECYEIIKNIAKKRVEKVLAYKEQFLAGFSKAIVDIENRSKDEADDLAHKVWQILEDSSAYSFNACISGQTKIRRAGTRCGLFCPTIEEMYKIKNDKEYAKLTNHKSLAEKYHREGYGNALSMCADGRIRKNKIVDIYEAGVRDVYQITTESGSSIVCTANHKFPSPNGEKRLDSLSVGDTLYVSGEYEINREKYPFTNGEFEPNTPKHGQRGFQKNPNGNSVTFKQVRAKHIKNEQPCFICKRDYDSEKRYELHHLDFERTNNDPENLVWLCVSCHKKIHYANNRTKIYQKGLPIIEDKIVSIEPAGREMTYDIEMAAPAHNFISESGLVTSNSHSYCVSIDSLYCAYLKSHYPLEFYEVFLNILEEKGAKTRMAETKEEAENYFGIKFPPYRFGQDNRAITADTANNSINNSLAAIKGFGSKVGEILYEAAQHEHSSFMNLLKYLNSVGLKTSKIEPLVKVDFFIQFGNITELLKLCEMFDFLKQGEAKSISKEKVPVGLEDILPKYATDKNKNGSEAKAYKLTDINRLMDEYERIIKSLGLPEPNYQTKMKDQLDLLGYIDLTTGKKDDRRKLIIMSVYPLPSKDGGDPWAYALQTRSIGTGNSARLTVYNNLYDKCPIMKGDIINAIDVKKNKKGYWYIYNYKKIS